MFRRCLLVALVSGCGFQPAASSGDGSVIGDGLGQDGDSGGSGSDASIATCWQFTPTNFDSCTLPTATAISVNSGSLSIDTDAPGSSAMLIAQPNGPMVVVMHLSSLDIGNTATLDVHGSHPLILAVETTATVSGTVTVAAGANDATSCAGATGSPGTTSTNNNASGGGGGGAGGATDGGDGGDGNNGSGNGHGTHGSHGSGVASTLHPLRAGCPGGAGGANNNAGTPGTGGSGGGALQISARVSIVSSGRFDASGSGAGVASARTGGGGGGSGGGLFFEAPAVTTSGILCADGGSGSEGGGGMASGGGGGRSPCTGISGAAGVEVTSFGGTPGRGGYKGNQTGGTGGTGGNDGANGGGGGGAGAGVGWIRLRAVGGTVMMSGVITPTPATS